MQNVRCLQGLSGVLLIGAFLAVTQPALSVAAPIRFGSAVDNMQASLKAAFDQLNSGNFVGAEADARALIADDPQSAAAHEILGTALVLQDRIPEGLAALQRAVEVNPMQATAWTKLGDLAQLEGRTAEAVAFFERAIAARPTERLAHQRLGLHYEAMGDLPRAVGHFEAGIQGLPPGFLGVRLNLALAYNQLGRPDDTLELLGPWEAAAGRGEAVAPIALRALGNAHTALDEPLAAIPLYRAALAQVPDDGLTMLALGIALRNSGDLAGSAEMLASAARVLPNEPVVMMEVAATAIAAGDAAQAEGQLAALVDLPSAPMEAFVRLIRVRLAAENAEGAEAAARALLARFPQVPAAHAELGTTLGALRRYDEAVVAFSSGLALAPTDPRLLRGLTTAAMRMGDMAAARAAVDRLVAVLPAEAEPLFLQGTIAEAAQDSAAAEASYRAALAVDPEYWPSLNNLAMLALARGDTAEARRLAEAAAALAPDVPAVQNTLARAVAGP